MLSFCKLLYLFLRDQQSVFGIYSVNSKADDSTYHVLQVSEEFT